MTTEAADNELRAAAFAAMKHSHAPYSHFCVGAAVRTETGAIAHGCNVENAAYPLGICAEQAAAAAAVAMGARRITMLAIATDGPEPTAPCGACRQFIAELADDLRITAYTVNGGARSWTLKELLPHPFMAEQLRRTPR